MAKENGEGQIRARFLQITEDTENKYCKDTQHSVEEARKDTLIFFIVEEMSMGWVHEQEFNRRKMALIDALQGNWELISKILYEDSLMFTDDEEIGPDHRIVVSRRNLSKLVFGRTE